MKHITDKERVYGLVCRYPGYPAAWYGWMLGGGLMQDGMPFDVMTCTFSTYQKIIKVQQRIHELAKAKRVIMRMPKVETMTAGLGVWPISAASEPVDATAEPVSVKVDNDTGQRGIRGLRDVLGGKS